VKALLRRPLRALFGGGKAPIPSTIKEAAPGSQEIVVVAALTAGGRHGPRLGIQ
jgi:hypothetical protein